jgi:hypothetical protein
MLAENESAEVWLAVLALLAGESQEERIGGGAAVLARLTLKSAE